MTSKLKCPFCQQELREIYFNGVGVGYICPNSYCKKAEKLKGNTELWQALIQAKQDLEIAKSYIKGISQMVINSGDNIYVVIGHFKKLAEQTLKQIEHKDK